MILTVNKKVNGFKVSNDLNKTIAMVERVKGAYKQKLITDGSRTFFKTAVVNDGKKYVIHSADEVVATAEVFYELDANQEPVHSFIRPPMAKELRINSSYGHFIMKQQQNRDVLIYDEGHEIGGFKKMLNLENKIICIEDGIDILFLVSLFVLATYMIHEDDIDIV